MIVIMVSVQALALLVAGYVSYYFTVRSASLWKVILGFLIAIPAGFVAALAVGVVIGEVFSIQTTNEATLRLVGYSFWFSVFGCIGGATFGKRHARKTRESKSHDYVISSNSNTSTNIKSKNKESIFQEPVNTIPSAAKPIKNDNGYSRQIDFEQMPVSLISKNEKELYEQIWKDIEENKVDVGLWAKCFADCDGDENKTKALYVNKKLAALKEELRKQVIDKEREAEERIKKARGASNDINSPEKLQPKSPKCPFSHCAGTIASDGSCLSCGHKWDKEEIKECYYCNNSFQRKDGYLHPSGEFVCRNCESSIVQPVGESDSSIGKPLYISVVLFGIFFIFLFIILLF
jgi:hypothetical protein